MSPRIKVQRVWQQVEEEWQVILRPGLCLLSFLHNVCVPECTMDYPVLGDSRFNEASCFITGEQQ